MSLHKLTAGSGYDYLTRQVAALDATDKGHAGLAGYYTAKGESPGRWVGSGLRGIDGVAAGDVVTADHMQNLFGAGHHPLATERTKALDLSVGRPDVDSPTEADYQTAARLGAPYKVYANDFSEFRIEVARRLAALNEGAGLPGDWPRTPAERAAIRTEVARDLFRAEHGRDAEDARELAASIARHSRPKTNAVAGYDLTFSPVKSVSVLWALADPRGAALIEEAHQSAVAEALDFIERKALFTRRGANGIRQVDVRGLVGAAFTHRDSRAGDPDLHTHVAVANKVQAHDGSWLAIDGRLLFKAKVSASETYNTALERHLTDALGIRFNERPSPDLGKRPIREVVGVDGALSRRFSKRRAHVEVRRRELVMAFHRDHGRPPTPVETLQLAQQATLETRESKHEPRSIAEQREAWRHEAVEELGTARMVDQMVRRVLRPGSVSAPPPDSVWFADAARRIVTTVERGRATWQYWHVYAEAQRQVRAANVATDQVSAAVELLVAEVLDNHSQQISGPEPGPQEPAELRRADGMSAYTVSGSQLFTSARVLRAEQRLVAAAGLRDGYTVAQSCVELAILECTANGVTLNAGQATLVREMATSGSRLQVGIAPAGSGKTTAMRALAAAWIGGGGTIIGLAPSAAAADALRSMIDTRTDTLAKLVHALEQARAVGSQVPDWVAEMGPSTLVIIDEAGMADTVSLDAAVAHVLARGGSVRLIGDDQQLAAIGAGGVLRDICATHGSLQLTELVRFVDSAEGAASLALREGRTEALGFYLDRGRVHVGDLATMTEDVFAAWAADRAAGLDSIMLAPTRDLVTELNEQARAHRLAGLGPGGAGPAQRLADGTFASVGDLVITRGNDRRLRTSATDWVKNGDRWLVSQVHDNGDLTVRHRRHGRTVRLPSSYVQTSTRLGYACTVHGAQGITADTMHGLATGRESRRQLYTMMSRGARANHVYLEVVGDGDPHSVIHPDLIHPLTPTDILESMLGRDDAQSSATTLIREQTDPAHRLGEAAQRYLDSLHVAAENLAGADLVAALETTADALLSGLRSEAAWPTLRAHLLLLGAQGEDPTAALLDAASERELTTSDDRAAVLGWRLDASGHPHARVGPLPWMPGVPERLAQDPHWGRYLSERADLVELLASEVRERALATPSLPPWAQNGIRPDIDTVADVEVWRAAMQVPVADRRPTGVRQLQHASATWQRRLDRRVTGGRSPALTEWQHLLDALAPGAGQDEFKPLLAERLAAISRAGLPAHLLLRNAAGAGTLPDEYGAAALWWRMARHLTPAVSAHVAQVGDAGITTADWVTRLPQLIGAERAAALQASDWWPALVSNVDHGLQRGWELENLLGTGSQPPGDDIDECQALVWRTSIALVPIPDEREYDEPVDGPPEDMWVGVEPDSWTAVGEPADIDEPSFGTDGLAAEVEADLALAAYLRDLGPTPLEPTPGDIALMLQRAEEWDHSPVPRERMLDINTMAQAFFERHFVDSWGREYLADRLGVDLMGDEQFRPGHAPAGWTSLVDHLRRADVSETELLATGLASRARTGRLIDRFRDRVMFPVAHNGQVLGFVGRRHPDLADGDARGPKYLNTAGTPLFHKGAQLFGVSGALLANGAIPVIVEGALDAIAVTLASAGRYVGVAPLGTALTEEQASQVSATGRDPIVATDADLAGYLAAERAFWLLTPHGLDPGYADFPQGLDPADLLTQRGPAALVAALDSAQRLSDRLISERVDNLEPAQARTAAIAVLAACPSHAWLPGTDEVVSRLQQSPVEVRRDLRDVVRTWDANPVLAAQLELLKSSDVRRRLEVAATMSPPERWAALATELDPRLVEQGDWPATAALLQLAHDSGHDVDAVVRGLLAEAPLGESPAREMRYRLAACVDLDLTEDAACDIPGKRAANPGAPSPASAGVRQSRPRR